MLILLDFVENYGFVVQDAVQGHHSTIAKQLCIPLLLMYYLNVNTLVSLIFCIIFDKMKHDTSAVRKFMSVILPQIKQILPNLIKCYDFSDGAGSQYKNYENFANLCHHKADFGVDAGWSFFATSHGKSPCDGISGTLKRLVACASLQMVSGQTITSSNEILIGVKKTSLVSVSFMFLQKVSESIPY